MPRSLQSLDDPSGSGGTAFRVSRELAKCKELNWPAYAYMRFVINGKQSIDRETQVADLLNTFPDLRKPGGPALFVNDVPNGQFIEAYTSRVQGVAWQAVATSAQLPKHRRDLLDRKDPSTGHALVLDCVPDLNAKIAAPLSFVFLNLIGPERSLQKLIDDVIPGKLAEDAALLVRIAAPDSDIVSALVKATAGHFGEAFACKPRGGHVLDPELFFVFVKSGCHKVDDGVWRAAFEYFQAERANVGREALDIFAYLDAIGLDTHEQCRKHYAETTRETPW